MKICDFLISIFAAESKLRLIIFWNFSEKNLINIQGLPVAFQGKHLNFLQNIFNGRGTLEEVRII